MDAQFPYSKPTTRHGTELKFLEMYATSVSTVLKNKKQTRLPLSERQTAFE